MRFLRSFWGDLRRSRAPAMAFVIVGMFWGAFAGLVPDLKGAIGASDGVFGITMLIASFGALAAMWLAPRIDQRLGARALQGGALFLALAFLLPGFASGPVFFTIAMLLASTGSGALDVIMNTRISGIEAESKRPLMNLNHALFSFAYAGAAISAGLFRDAGFGPLVVFAVIAACAVSLLGMLYHEQAQVAGSEGGDASRAPKMLVLIGGVIILIAFLAEQATEAWSALHLERGLGASAAEGAMGPALLGITMGIGRMSGQFIAAKARETVVLQIAAALAAVGIVLAGSASSIFTAYVGFATMGLGVSVLAPMAYSAVGKRVNAEQRTAAITRISVIGYMGFFIGPPLMGGLSEAFSLSVSFYAVAAILGSITLFLAPKLRTQ